MKRLDEDEPKNPLTLAATFDPFDVNKADTGVLSCAHLRSNDMASSRDMLMFRLYVQEFGPELAVFFARGHNLRIDIKE